MNYAAFKKTFETYIEKCVTSQIENARSLISDRRLRTYVQHAAMIIAGGKRLRPYLAYVMWQTAKGEESEEIWKAIVGIELFHVFALIHDDVIDRGTERHGVPTLNAFVREATSVESALSQMRYAESQAILVGDLVFNWSYQALLDHAIGSFEEVRGIFGEMVNEVVVGQMIDVNITSKDDAPTEEIRIKNELKTVRYSFVHPMRLGAAMAGQLDGLEPFAEDLGYALGMAFQIQDDLLDISSENTGKKPLRDIVNGQHTFLSEYIFRNGSAREKRQLRSFFKRALSDEDMRKVIELFKESGALRYGQDLARTFFAEAHRIIDREHIDSGMKPVWHDLVTLIESRNS